MVKAVIIDDEKKARDFIELILQKNIPEIEIIERASSVVEGIKIIQKNNPDIVFLDIEMQDGTGFDVLEAIPNKNFDFIFVTAYNHYAIKAFKYSAVDYVIKPIDIEDFLNAVKKILDKRSDKRLENNYDALKTNINSRTPLKIALPVLDGIDFIDTSNVVSINADGRYSRFFLNDKRKIIVSKSLGEFNDLIDDKTFFKPHKSHIINLKHVVKYIKKGNYILMSDDSEVPLSRGNRESFLSAMKIKP